MKVWCGNLLSIGQRSRCLVFDAAGRPFSEYFRYRGSTNNCQGFCIVLQVFHTYSAFARGVETVGNAYSWLDLTAFGRGEEWEEPKGRATTVHGADPTFTD
jgi:hypothetical protein